jgi:hypothetical protein
MPLGLNIDRNRLRILLFALGLVLSSRGYSQESGLISFQDQGKYGFKNLQGEVVIPAKYDDCWEFRDGLAPVNIGAVWEFPGFQVGGKWGYINEKGETVVPLSLDFAAPFSEGLARIESDGEKCYINSVGKYVIQLPREVCSFGNFSEGFAVIQKKDGVAANRTTEVIDKEGKLVFSLQPGRTSHGKFSEGFLAVHQDISTKNTAHGECWNTEYLDKQGKIIFSVLGYGENFHEGLAAVIVRKKKVDSEETTSLSGFVDTKGTWVIQPRFAEVREFSEGLAAVRPQKTTVYGMGDSWGYINSKGETVIELRFNEAHSFVKKMALVHVGGTLRTYTDVPPFWEGGEWMVIDPSGNILHRSNKWIDMALFANKR